MALDLKLQINTSEDCKNLVIQDVTGGYNPASNPGGWGNFNITGNRDFYNMIVHITVFHFINGEQYSSSIALPNFNNYVIYPSRKLHRGFKVSIPASDIYSDISLLPDIPEEFDPMQEFLEDTFYKITVQISSARIAQFISQQGSNNLVGGGSISYDELSREEYLQQFDYMYSSTCLTQKAVDKFMATVNLDCEDCDDTDVDKALLAKNLLENLKNL